MSVLLVVLNRIQSLWERSSSFFKTGFGLSHVSCEETKREEPGFEVRLFPTCKVVSTLRYRYRQVHRGINVITGW